MLEKALLSALAGSGERGAMRFLARHPEVLVWGFCRTGGHSIYVLKEFPLGSRYRADFVVAFSYSGTWELHFVELEPVGDRIMTRKGTPSARLNSAIAQLNEWRDHIDRNRFSVQEDASRWCMKRDLLNWHAHDHAPCNYTGDYLRDPETHIWFNYHIIIGRRAVATREVRRRMNQYCGSGDISIGTYDRFVDIASNHDRYNADPNRSIYLPATKDETDQA
jgi:hypothetical protein